ncbi:hypothetical protein CDAR_398061 [Caerostris darwini]|uniref:Uncharacterized protein n=1 Tax=Caerostris darwini TaxID=1538125 RepID=A0AAV4WTR4_9ARAC|nr:hypothetical protein CDAR_398061 [Caerostris darwini]
MFLLTREKTPKTFCARLHVDESCSHILAFCDESDLWKSPPIRPELRSMILSLTASAECLAADRGREPSPPPVAKICLRALRGSGMLGAH